LKIKDIMHTDFVSFQADDSLEHILNCFIENNMTSAPVFDGEKFVGIITEFGLVKHFTPKKFHSLWKKDKQTPIEEMRSVVARDIAKKPPVKLTPVQELHSAIKKVSDIQYCVPVFENNKLVGVVRSRDVAKFFATEFVKDEAKKIPEVMATVGDKTDMSVDQMLEIINNCNSPVTAVEIAKRLDISLESVEKIAGCLYKYDLVEVQHSFFRGTRLKKCTPVYSTL